LKSRNHINLFIIQNENHYLNFFHRSKDNIPHCLVFLDNYSGLKICNDKINLSENTIVPNNRSGILIKNKSFLKKILCVYLFSRELEREIHSKIDGYKKVNIIIGNDGALQKASISVIKKINKNVYVSLLIDTIMGDRKKTLNAKLKSVFEPILSFFGISQYFPGILGTSSLIDSVTVSHKSNKDVLIRRGVSPEMIFIKDSPRISWLKKESNNLPRNKKILFVAGAWEWHGRTDVEDWQSKVLENLVTAASHHPNGDLIKIRLHPRQFKKSTSKLNSRFICDKKNLEESIITSNKIISFRSSALYDASVIGKEVYIYEKNAPHSPKNEFMQSIQRLNSIEDILKLTQ